MLIIHRNNHIPPAVWKIARIIHHAAVFPFGAIIILLYGELLRLFLSSARDRFVTDRINSRSYRGYHVLSTYLRRPSVRRDSRKIARAALYERFQSCLYGAS